MFIAKRQLAEPSSVRSGMSYPAVAVTHYAAPDGAYEHPCGNV